jgi:phage shock protein E
MRLYVWKFSLIVTALVALTFACAPVRADNTIAPSELADRINTAKAPMILDVRTSGEYANGHIPGAINIPHGELHDRLSELLPHQNEEIVVHCQGGSRAGIAQFVLSEAGFKQIRELEGHMQQWKAGGYPIE